MGSTGWNRPQVGKPSAPEKKPARLKGICSALIVVVGAVVAFLFLSSPSTEKREKVEKKPATIKEVKPVAMPKPAPVAERPKPAPTNLPPNYVNAKGLDPKLFPYDDGRKVISTVTNETWNRITDMCIMPSGKTRKVIRDLRPPVYDNISDQLLAMALAGENDEEIPPLPIPSEQELEQAFIDSMKKPIVIHDDDPEPVKESKRRVMEARQVIDEQLKQGKGYREILEQHVADRKQGAALREEAMRGAMELKKTGDVEGLNEYLKGVNEFLDSHGVRGIKEPHRKGHGKVEQ